jgi:hypothetical protein
MPVFSGRIMTPTSSSRRRTVRVHTTLTVFISVYAPQRESTLQQPCRAMLNLVIWHQMATIMRHETNAMISCTSTEEPQPSDRGLQ